MNTYVSMLRGINVGGQKKIRMGELISLYESLGLENIRTYVQSGNVIFDSSISDASRLSVLIEEKIEQLLGFSVIVLIRTMNELRQVIENNPYMMDSTIDVTKLHVTFLSGVPEAAALKRLKTIRDEIDDFKLVNREIFLFCPNGYGGTKLSNSFFEKKLNVAATTRNWKTVNTLFDLAKNRIPN